MADDPTKPGDKDAEKRRAEDIAAGRDAVQAPAGFRVASDDERHALTRAAKAEKAVKDELAQLRDQVERAQDRIAELEAVESVHEKRLKKLGGVFQDGFWWVPEAK